MLVLIVKITATIKWSNVQKIANVFILKWRERYPKMGRAMALIGFQTRSHKTRNHRVWGWKVTSWRLDFGTWVRDQMNSATKCTSWQACALKDTLTVTNICHEVILQSREVTDCSEHVLVTNLFKSKNPWPSPANPNIHMYAFWVEVIPYWVVTFVNCVTFKRSQCVATVCQPITKMIWHSALVELMISFKTTEWKQIVWRDVNFKSNFVTQFIGVIITLKFITWVESSNFKFECDLRSGLLNIAVRFSAGFGL